MKLWKTYFKLWNRFCDSLTERKTQSETKEESIQEERGSNDYGYLWDKETCLESGV